MHEYKVVPAPDRAVKVRGLKTTEARFAHQFTETLNREAEGGWEFLRSETLPCTERKGFTGIRTTTQVMLIFRRDLVPAERAEHPAVEGDARRTEPVFRPGALSRTAGERDMPPLRTADARTGPDAELSRGDTRNDRREN